MATKQIIGIALLVVGVVLIGVGYNASQAPVDQVTEAFTGRFTDRTMMYLVAGIAAAAVGALMAFFGRRA